jgi:signal transduction histidine kinase
MLSAPSLRNRATDLLRIVREAITNARRHSGARVIRVDAGGSSSETLRLEISDDGDWPDRSSAMTSRRGTGIPGMLERAERLGAELRIEQRPAGGTNVSVDLALTGEDRSVTGA